MHLIATLSPLANRPRRMALLILLYLLAAQGIRYVGPGIYHKNIDVFEALTIWKVHDVRVFGTGAIIYDGPQDPLEDEGWQDKKNWHCIVMG